MNENKQKWVNPRIQEIAKRMLGKEVTAEEVSLMLYVQNRIIGYKFLEYDMLNLTKQKIISDWKRRGYIQEVNHMLEMSKEFWDAICEIIYIEHVETKKKLDTPYRLLVEENDMREVCYGFSIPEDVEYLGNGYYASYITKEEFDFQNKIYHKDWYCPYTGLKAIFDEKYYEEYMKYPPVYYHEVEDNEGNMVLATVNEKEIEDAQKEFEQTGNCSHIWEDISGLAYNTQRCIICDEIKSI